MIYSMGVQSVDSVASISLDRVSQLNYPVLESAI